METPQTLSRRLGPYSAAAVVIGSVIGSGIFLTPQRVAAVVQIPGIMIAVWVLTGLLTLAGLPLYFYWKRTATT
jgi:phosphate/sulfate permease